jgi:hypothetical protein
MATGTTTTAQAAQLRGYHALRDRCRRQPTPTCLHPLMRPNAQLTIARLRGLASVAACTWALLFAAPHTWWALGYTAGFPGGDASYHRFMSSAWRYWYDVLVVVLSMLAFILAFSLRADRTPSRLQRALRIAAWLGGAVLALRGIAGLIVDGRGDPVWWPTFLLGGVLFLGVAYLASLNARRGNSSVQAA